MSDNNRKILRELIEAQYVSVFKGESREQWKDRMVEEAMAKMTPNLRSLHDSGSTIVLDVATHLANRTLLPPVAAFEVAPRLVAIVLDSFKAGQPLSAHLALSWIRQAGNNTSAWATWAQRTAAWGMEPHKWPMQTMGAPEEPKEDHVAMPAALSAEMRKAGGKVNSEWLNDNAPIGESRYQTSMDAVYEAFQKAHEKEKKNA